jgi:hypothetical protein
MALETGLGSFIGSGRYRSAATREGLVERAAKAHLLAES